MQEIAASHQLAASHPVDGICDWDARTIFLYDKLAGRDLIDTTIHEYLHGVRGDCTEEWVTQTATELATILFDVMGYRGPADGE